MNQSAYGIGQAVFLRTDTADFAEETVPFKTLEEMVAICSIPRDNLILEKVVVYSMLEGTPAAVTLSFVSASRGQRPGAMETAYGAD
ncbi:MAG: hypothetical protein WCO56_26875 [Verrucomicrobiota bacterium]